MKRFHRCAVRDNTGQVTICVFKARDGKWAYCPQVVRNDPAFSFHGQFPTQADAIVAVERDRTCVGFNVLVEAE